MGLCLGFRRSKAKGTRRMKRTSSRPKIVVSGDGRGVVGHAGTRLLADLGRERVAQGAGQRVGVAGAGELSGQQEQVHLDGSRRPAAILGRLSSHAVPVTGSVAGRAVR